MDEWWTYSLSDLLLFSPRTYYRMLGHHNEAAWPGQILTLGLGLGILGLLRRSTPWQGRIISSIVAMLWAWVAWSFLGRRYATINPVATYFAWLFAIEALLLMWLGAIRGQLRFRPSRGAAGMLGIVVFVMALTLYPVLAPLGGRPWVQGEIFGVAPDPTGLATLGLLLLTEGRPRWELVVIPALWLSISSATLWAMGSPEAMILSSTALLVLVASARLQGRRTGFEFPPTAL
jgi:uncharacterized protein DUF6064